MTADEAMAAAEGYVRGVAEQDRAGLRALFAGTATISGLDEGNWVDVPRDRWIDFVCAPERKGAGAAESRIRSVTLEESVATVVVETVFGGFRYHDILLVGAHPDGPRILCKAFHQFAAA
ncbi:MAG: nuclear transport factor 2 family protein [Bauldia sp.]|uniref:nuclear transport factor 2 family protein n=1 Tax=Bauldia sp. TaxID=2575872 RepID=UPI001D564EA0|nr:nuclear transport factor 2 family protein [Bauldia sp.]MCB1496261.1 nuclear transport factor 2 family protein [Bauldia sp.]